jgi:hypothetical protein
MGTEQEKSKDSELYKTVHGRTLRNKHGRLTAFGKVQVLKHAMAEIAELRQPVVVVDYLMTTFGLSRKKAITAYDQAESEFQLLHKPFSQSQCDNAVQMTLRSVMVDKTATPSARVAAAKELGRINDTEEIGEDDESRCKHYESLWSRKINAACKISTEAIVEIRDYVASIDFDLFAISEREVEILEEKAGKSGG